MKMKIDAIVLAGGQLNDLVITEDSPAIKAMIKLGGRPMLDYVLEALAGSEKVGRIVVLSPKPLGGGDWSEKINRLIVTDDTITANIAKGIKYLGEEGRFLLISSDIPFLTPEALDDFLEKTEGVNAELYYPIIAKEAVEKQFPKSQRTYITLKEGVFTGGNIFLIGKRAFLENKSNGEKMFSYRKSPLKMIGLIGIATIIKFLTRRLTIPELENKASEILACRSRAIISDYAGIGVDVDKAADIELYEKLIDRPKKLF